MKTLILIVVCFSLGFAARDGVEWVRNNLHFEPVDHHSSVQVGSFSISVHGH